MPTHRISSILFSFVLASAIIFGLMMTVNSVQAQPPEPFTNLHIRSPQLMSEIKGEIWVGAPADELYTRAYTITIFSIEKEEVVAIVEGSVVKMAEFEVALEAAGAYRAELEVEGGLYSEDFFTAESYRISGTSVQFQGLVELQVAAGYIPTTTKEVHLYAIDDLDGSLVYTETLTLAAGQVTTTVLAEMGSGEYTFSLSEGAGALTRKGIKVVPLIEAALSVRLARNVYQHAVSVEGTTTIVTPTQNQFSVIFSMSTEDGFYRSVSTGLGGTQPPEKTLPVLVPAGELYTATMELWSYHDGEAVMMYSKSQQIQVERLQMMYLPLIVVPQEPTTIGDSCIAPDPCSDVQPPAESYP